MRLFSSSLLQAQDHAFLKRRRNTQVSKKMNCPVGIYVKQVVKFPDFKVIKQDGYKLRSTV